MKKPNFVRQCIEKKTGRETFCSPPRLRNRSAIALELIEHLQGQSCLVSVGFTTPSLKDRSISKVLPHLGPPQKHLSELVSPRQSEFAQGNVVYRCRGREAERPRRLRIQKHLCPERRTKAVGPVVRGYTR